jgi:tetratricopeptide (TPR) repeat protein
MVLYEEFAMSVEPNNLALEMKAYASGRYRTAERLLKRKLRQHEQLVSSEEQAEVVALTMLGNACREQDHFAEADSNYERAIELIVQHRMQNSMAHLSALREYGLSLTLQGKFFASIETEEMALDVAQQLAKRERFEVNASLSRLCALSRAALDYPRADIYYRQLIKFREQSLGNLDSSLADLWIELGIINYHLREFAEAERCFKISAQLLNQGKETEENPGLLRDIGVSLCAQGRFSEARKYCNKSSQIEERDEVQDEERVLTELADHYCWRKCFDNAMKLCKDAFAAREFGTLSNVTKLSNALNFYVYTLKRLNCCENPAFILSRIARLEKSDDRLIESA